MKQYLDELKSIEERFLASDDADEGAENKMVVDPAKDAPADDYQVQPVDNDMTEREVDDLTGATPEEVKEAIEMLLSVSRASIGKIKSILDQLDEAELVLDEGIFEQIDELILDAEDLGDLVDEVEGMGDISVEEVPDEEVPADDGADIPDVVDSENPKDESPLA